MVNNGSSELPLKTASEEYGVLRMSFQLLFHNDFVFRSVMPSLLALSVLTAAICSCFAEEWCATAPDEGRRETCLHIHAMDHMARVGNCKVVSKFLSLLFISELSFSLDFLSF